MFSVFPGGGRMINEKTQCYYCNKYFKTGYTVIDIGFVCKICMEDEQCLNQKFVTYS